MPHGHFKHETWACKSFKISSFNLNLSTCTQKLTILMFLVWFSIRLKFTFHSHVLRIYQVHLLTRPYRLRTRDWLTVLIGPDSWPAAAGRILFWTTYRRVADTDTTIVIVGIYNWRTIARSRTTAYGKAIFLFHVKG